MQRIMLRALVLFIFIITAATCYSQNIAWLQGNWKGKSYLPGSSETQYFSLTLRVQTIKGKKFEGVLSTMEPYDTTIRYDAKINGELFEDYLIINPTKVFYVKNSPGSRWMLSCINCKPAKMMFSLQNGKFSIKGATEECYQQCNGISEFSKALEDMNAENQDSLYALMHLQKPQIIVALLKDTSAQKVPDETVAFQRTVLAPAGDIVTIETGSAVLAPKTISQELNKKPSSNVPDNPMPRRVPLTPAGNIVAIKDDKALLASQDLLKSLKRSKPSLIIQQSTVSAEDRNIPVSVDTITTLVDNNKKATTIKNPVFLPDTVSILPAGYSERKVAVIRTLPVNTDSVTIRVYDNGVIDGDVVSVVYNDKVVIDKLSLTSKAMTIKIPVNAEGLNTLVFYAHNLGEFPPNTAKLEIIYGNKREELTISSDYTISSSVNIVYNP
ncbi:hypothetical protein BH10BAC2_BH10BAC2_44440 [soil metagenome]